MTYQFKRIVKSVDEESILGLKRKQKIEREPAFKAGASRFPDFADGRRCLGFATLSHGSIRTWSQLRDAQGHNTRVTWGPNIRDDAPPPIELLEDASGSYEERVKHVLDLHDVPHTIRLNGVVATEDIYGASPEYWNRDGDWKKKDPSEIVRDPVVQRAIEVARARHGATLVSCSLHLDEASPHIHVIAIPLVKKLHKPRGRKPKDCLIGADGKAIDYRKPVEKWSIDWSTTRGRTSHMELAHDNWAAAVNDLGLARGSKGSEMTEEDRRTRRQLQTGRASDGGKRIREERERIICEAEARAAEIENQSWAKAVELDLHIDTLLNNVETRERSLDGREAILAKREAELATEKAEQDAERRRLEAEQQIQKATAAANEARTATLNAFDQEVRRKDAKVEGRIAYANEVLERMRQATAFVAAASRPGGHRLFGTDENGPKPIDQNGCEPAWWADMAPELKAEFRACFAGLLEAADLRQKLNEDSKDLDEAWALYEASSEIVKKWCGRAVEFVDAWKGVPETDRSPGILIALEKAKGLTLDDLPLGFGSASRGQGL